MYYCSDLVFSCPLGQTFMCGPEVPPTCENPMDIDHTQSCIEGCFCNDGTILDLNGNCIPPRSCPVGTSYHLSLYVKNIAFAIS